MSFKPFTLSVDCEISKNLQVAPVDFQLYSSNSGSVQILKTLNASQNHKKKISRNQVIKEANNDNF